MIEATKNFHIISLPTNPENPKQIVKQAIDSKTGDILGTIKMAATEKKFYPKGEINSCFLIPSYNSIKMAKPHIYVQDLFVHTAARNKGVGTALIAEAAKESKNRGYLGRVILLAGSNEKSPLPFYKKLGFVTTSKNLNNNLDYAVKYKLNINNSIQAFMTLSIDAAKKLIKSFL